MDLSSLQSLHIPNMWGTICTNMNCQEMAIIKDADNEINFNILSGLWVNFRLNDEMALKYFPNVSHLNPELTSEQILKFTYLYNYLVPYYHELLKVIKGRLFMISNIKNGNGLMIMKDNDKFLTGSIILNESTYTSYLDIFTDISKESGYFGHQYLLLLWH